jgi:RIO-like serine/threonine protein kinase
LEDFKSISVTSVGRGKLEVVNPTRYEFIAKGWHGAIFKLSDSQCVKIFADKKVAEDEIRSYKKMSGSSLIPKLYETGPNYIVMEYIKGLTVVEYLKREKELSESMARQFLAILQEFKRLQLTMLDFELDNAIVTEDNTIKIIDLASSFRSKFEKPEYLFKTLHRLKLLSQFMEHVKNIDSTTYQDWKKVVSKEMGLLDLD